MKKILGKIGAFFLRLVSNKLAMIITGSVLAVLLTVLLIVLAGCGSDEDLPATLEAPTVTLDGDTASWGAVENAQKFEISLDGALSYMESSVTRYKLTDGQSFKVRAIGDGVSFSDSEWSNTVVYNDESGEEEEQPKLYTVTWMCDGTVLETDTLVPYGSMPTYNGSIPERAATAEFSYAFSGWTPELSPITASVVYEARFREEKNKYTVKFFAEDGVTVLEEIETVYGSAVNFSKPLPTKKPTESHTFEFLGWLTEKGGSSVADLSFIDSNKNFYPSFKETLKKFTVFLVSDNVSFGTLSKAAVYNVDYGTEITSVGSTLVIGQESVMAIPMPSSAEYEYTFDGFVYDSTVTSDITVTARFVRTKRAYTVTWMQDGNVLEVDNRVEYGSYPVYNGNQPFKVEGGVAYVFAGWTPSVSNVTGDVTYYARFIDTSGKYAVTFYSEDGTVILGVAAAEYGMPVVYPNSTPEKASTEAFVFSFDKWVTSKGGDTEADLSSVKSNFPVFAKFKSEPRRYEVTFVDYDGTVLKTEEVAYGTAAIAPPEPDRDGYRFSGWNKAFDSITGEITVMAEYVQTFTVQFIDYDNSIISTVTVDRGKDAGAPALPTRVGYRFSAWSNSYTNVLGDIVCRAQYVKQYSAKFFSHDGTLIEEVYVDKYETPTPPDAPTLTGYTFVGWSGSFENLTQDVIVRAEYRLNTYKVEFMYPDGTLIDSQTVEHGFAATAPDDPVCYFDRSGSAVSVKRFGGWNGKFDTVTEDTVVYAVFDEPYTDLVVIVETDAANATATMYISNNNGKYLYGLEAYFSYAVSDGSGAISVISALPNAAGIFGAANEQRENMECVINDNEKEFTLAWSNIDGEKFSYVDTAMSFKIETSGASDVLTDNFKLIECSAVVGDAAAANTETITAYIVMIAK